MNYEVVHTTEAPAAIGPYVQATKAGNTVYISGQLGIDMVTGEIPASVSLQTKHSLANLAAILEAAGSSVEQVVKTTIFLTDMADFATVNEIYGSFFDTSKPARSCVQVVALPKGGKVEIEAIALV